MSYRGPVATALRVSRVSTPELTNATTALTSLVAVPLLEVVLIVAVSASLGGSDLVTTAYAAILLAYGLAIVGGTIERVSADRQLGVLQEALAYQFFYVPYWLSKVAIPTALGSSVAVASCAAVYAIDSERSVNALMSAVVLIPFVAVGACLAAIGIATLSVGFKDPYLVSNTMQGFLPLTAGIVVPLSSYPILLATVAQAFPFTAAVEAMRAIGLNHGAQTIMLLLGRELIVCVAWLALGVFVSRYVVRALRDGRRREEIW